MTFQEILQALDKIASEPLTMAIGISVAAGMVAFLLGRIYEARRLRNHVEWYSKSRHYWRRRYDDLLNDWMAEQEERAHIKDWCTPPDEKDQQ